jgi:muramoyltetrapeptide carboxypeptidase
MYAMLHEYLQHWHIPVCYDFPTGHAHLRNFPLLTGANATLDVSNEAVVLRYDN